jgi:hypothetical protein
MSHLCPGYALHDCPHGARIEDEPEDVDRCPSCHARNAAWEMDLRLAGQTYTQCLDHIATTGTIAVFNAMQRALND